MKFYFTLLVFLLANKFALCQNTVSFSRGSCIIDMGVVPQTINNGLKPYGLLYQLLNVYKIPVYWAIKPDKTFGIDPLNKIDETDFVLDGIHFKAGAFIISNLYLPQINSVINQWEAQGVVTYYASNDFTLPNCFLLTRIPKAVLDSRNSVTIINGFFSRAGIPDSAYLTEGVPYDPCRYIYALPHSEPNLWTQAYKDSLLTFINNRGAFFSSCSSVSAIESNPGMNFLSSTGLLRDSSHTDGTPPYAYSLNAGFTSSSVASDPLMQSVGKLDDAIDWGAETIYIPNTSWRSSTKVSIYDSNFVNNGIMYPNQAAVMTYGRAFGDNSKGLVVYLAGHDFDHGTEVANVAAARIFGNFLLYSSILYSPVINSVMIPTTANAGEQINLSVSVSQSYSPIVYYEWSSNLNGVFTNQSLSTIFIPPNVDTPTICTVQIKVIDECGREGLYHANILILPKNDPCLKVDPSKIFTPNNDGLYDKWVAFKSNCISKVEAFVYNRWGGLVYHSENYNNNWDGTYKNKPLPDATYYYVLNIVENSGLRYTKKGSITIMR